MVVCLINPYAEALIQTTKYSIDDVCQLCMRTKAWFPQRIYLQRSTLVIYLKEVG